MKKFVLVAASLLLLGCATAYQPMGLTGGYTDTKLSADTFKIKFEGNVNTTKERAAVLTMLRASELTLSNGYTHFVTLEDKLEMVPAYRDSPSGIRYLGDRPSVNMVIKCYNSSPTGVKSYDAIEWQKTAKKLTNTQ